MKNNTVELTEEVVQFLDNLRESSVTNMFGAAPYIMEEFDVDRNMARDLLKHWMENFDG